MHSFLYHTFVLFAVLSSISCQSFSSQNGTISSSLEIPSGLSPQCNASFNASIQCDNKLADVAFSGRFADDNDLQDMCTTKCLTSLERFQDQQKKACRTDTIVADGLTYPATLAVDQLIFTYNYTCKRDPKTQAFCATQIESSQNGSRTDVQDCSTCFIDTMRTQLNSPFGYDKDLAQRFELIASSCKLNEQPIPEPSSYTLDCNNSTSSNISTPSVATSADANSTLNGPGCDQSLAIKAGDDCYKISSANNISTFSLLDENNLAAYCSEFPLNGTLCMPQTCAVYEVKKGDSCFGIAHAHSHRFTQTQLMSWNPNINRGCSNLRQLEKSYICVSMPGGATLPLVTLPSSVPYGNSTAGNSTQGPSQTKKRATTGPTATYWEFPTPDSASASASASADPTLPLILAVPSGTSRTCEEYDSYVTADTNISNPNTCDYLAYFYGFKVEDFVKWNPSLSYKENDPSACVLAKGFRYCVRPGNGSISGLGSVGPSVSASKFSPSTASSLPTSNSAGPEPTPSRPSPTSFTTSASRTSATGTVAIPTQLGVVAGCKKWHEVVKGDGCPEIAKEYAIDVDSFEKWNAAVGKDCTMLETGFNVCVGV